MPDNINTYTEPRHTEEIQDIIGNPPAWLLRWGILLFFCILLLILAAAEVIRYPDIVEVQLKIQSDNRPLAVTATVPGKLVELTAVNDQDVKSGELLAVIESSKQAIKIVAPKTGRLTYAGIVHENQDMAVNQKLFYVTEKGGDFFGEVIIPETQASKVKTGQDVMIKLKDYPFEENGMLHGKVKYITDSPFRDGQFIAEIDFNQKNYTDMNKPLLLKYGMIANADIITQNSSLLNRLINNIFRNINH